jgi:uncharacterized protein DUF6585
MATNTISQEMLPLAVQKVAESQQLGAFVKGYKPNLVRTSIGAFVMLLGAAFFLVGGIFPPDLTVRTRVVLLVFGPLCLGLAIYMIFRVLQAANQQVYLFQHGIVIDNSRHVQAFPWSRAAEVRQSITRNYRNGIYVGTTYIFTLRRADGYQVKLGNLTKGIAELGPAIAQGITRELVPRAFQSIQAGQTLSFAPFRVNQQGISNGREMLPWSHVQAVDVKQGRVTVTRVGMSRAWGTAMVAKIPNYLVFIVVAEELKKRAGGMQA